MRSSRIMRQLCIISAACCLLLSGCQESAGNSFSDLGSEDSTVSIPELEQSDSAFHINIDSVTNAVISGNEIFLTESSGSVKISGWAVSPSKDDSLSSMYMKAGDSVYIGSYGICRNDVAQALGFVEATYCGFSFSVPVSAFFTEEGNTVEKISLYGVSHDLKDLFMPIEFDVIFGEPVQTSEQSGEGHDEILENVASLPDIEQRDEAASVCVDSCNDRNVGYGGNILLNDNDSVFSISGWALNSDFAEPLSALYVIAGDKVFAADYGKSRNDVADSYGNDKLVNCGFSFEVSMSELCSNTGTIPEAIEFVGVSADGSYITQPFVYMISQ